LLRLANQGTGKALDGSLVVGDARGEFGGLSVTIRIQQMILYCTRVYPTDRDAGAKLKVHVEYDVVVQSMLPAIGLELNMTPVARQHKPDTSILRATVVMAGTAIVPGNTGCRSGYSR
jgi:hypothetical protein